MDIVILVAYMKDYANVMICGSERTPYRGLLRQDLVNEIQDYLRTQFSSDNQVFVGKIWILT